VCVEILGLPGRGCMAGLPPCIAVTEPASMRVQVEGSRVCDWICALRLSSRPATLLIPRFFACAVGEFAFSKTLRNFGGGLVQVTRQHACLRRPCVAVDMPGCEA
jgi:hypothetical protein